MLSGEVRYKKANKYIKTKNNSDNKKTEPFARGEQDITG